MLFILTTILHLYIFIYTILIVLELLLFYDKIVFSLCLLQPQLFVPLNSLLPLLLSLLILLLLLLPDLLLDLVEDLAVLRQIADPAKLGSRSRPPIRLPTQITRLLPALGLRQLRLARRHSILIRLT